MKVGVVIGLGLGLGLGLGCAGGEDDAVRADVQLVAMAQGAPPPGAMERLEQRGRRALPAIEAAMHTAEPSGRKNLVLALRRIGDVEAVPLLRHVAFADDDASVRREAEWTLKQWAADKDARGDRARDALRALDERREREEAG